MDSHSPLVRGLMLAFGFLHAFRFLLAFRFMLAFSLMLTFRLTSAFTDSSRFHEPAFAFDFSFASVALKSICTPFTIHVYSLGFVGFLPPLAFRVLPFLDLENLGLGESMGIDNHPQSPGIDGNIQPPAINRNRQE
jgi:hypothetical protein